MEFIDILRKSLFHIIYNIKENKSKNNKCIFFLLGYKSILLLLLLLLLL